MPGTAAPIAIEFNDIAGSSCGALLPSSNIVDEFDNVAVTLIDNGMPVVLLRAKDLGISGFESREELEANQELKQKLESIRLQAGPVMNLGDVEKKSVPKMSLIAEPAQGGTLTTRTFIPHRCHASIGVLGAVSVATAAVLPGSVADGLAVVPQGATKSLSIEHPIGEMTVIFTTSEQGDITSTAILRTARKLFDGVVFPH